MIFFFWKKFVEFFRFFSRFQRPLPPPPKKKINSFSSHLRFAVHPAAPVVQVPVRPGPSHALERLDELRGSPEVGRPASVPPVGVGVEADACGVGEERRRRRGEEDERREDGAEGEEGHTCQEGVGTRGGHVFFVNVLPVLFWFLEREGGRKKKREEKKKEERKKEKKRDEFFDENEGKDFVFFLLSLFLSSLTPNRWKKASTKKKTRASPCEIALVCSLNIIIQTTQTMTPVRPKKRRKRAKESTARGTKRFKKKKKKRRATKFG